jgi:hypothetical protein
VRTYNTTDMHVYSGSHVGEWDVDDSVLMEGALGVTVEKVFVSLT